MLLMVCLSAIQLPEAMEGVILKLTLVTVQALLIPMILKASAY